MLAPLPSLLRALPVLLLCAAVAACGDDEADAPTTQEDTGQADRGADPGTVDPGTSDTPDPRLSDEPERGDAGAPHLPLVIDAGGGTSLRVSSSGLELLHGEEVRVRLPVDSFVIGTVPELDGTRAYDPYFLEPGAELGHLYQPLGGLEWSAAQALSVWDADGEVKLFELQFEDRDLPAELAIRAEGPGRISMKLTHSNEGPAVFTRLRLRADAQEGFYGLGEYFDQPEHRGKLRAMHFEVAKLQSGYNEAHVPVPFLIGTSGWGVFVESMRPGVFAVATEEEDLVQVTFGQGPAWQQPLSVHLYTADHPLDITKSYYETTAYPGLPAPWALGPWIWRDEVEGQAAVETDLQTIRDLDLATTGYWIDRPYASDVNSFDFHPDNYADPAAMMAKAHDLGFKMALWHTPYVDPDGDASRPLYDEAVEKGYFPPETAMLAKWGPPLDLTNEDAVEWWRGLLKRYTDLGIVGYKLDYAEEVIPSTFGRRAAWLFSDRSDERTMHRGYQYLYQQTYAATLPEDGGFLLCRAGAYGSQRFGTIIWPGDIDASMVRHREERTNAKGETYTSVGGVPAAVVAGSSLGPSGFPFFASDTGGYRNAPPDRETFTRWFEHTALTPVMQVGTNTNDLPWEFGEERAKDEEMLGWYRHYARLHLRLFPYLWTHAKRLLTTGRPIQRPLGLAYPELGSHPWFTYLLGDDVLVAPVVDHGARKRKLQLPPGSWLDWWTAASYEGEQEIEVEAPLETIPLFLRGGSAVPMLGEKIDTLLPVKDTAAVESLATSAGRLFVRAAPLPGSWTSGASATEETTLYDGTALRSKWSPTEEGAEGVVEIEPGEIFKQGFVLELLTPAGVEVVAVEGPEGPLTKHDDAAALATAGAGWRSDRDGALTRVEPPEAATSVTLRLQPAD